MGIPPRCLKLPCFLVRFYGLAKMHQVCVNAAFRISGFVKYAVSGVCLARAVYGRSILKALLYRTYPLQTSGYKGNEKTTSILSCLEFNNEQAVYDYVEAHIWPTGSDMP